MAMAELFRCLKAKQIKIVSICNVSKLFKYCAFAKFVKNCVLVASSVVVLGFFRFIMADISIMPPFPP